MPLPHSNKHCLKVQNLGIHPGPAEPLSRPAERPNKQITSYFRHHRITTCIIVRQLVRQRPPSRCTVRTVLLQLMQYRPASRHSGYSTRRPLLWPCLWPDLSLLGATTTSSDTAGLDHTQMRYYDAAYDSEVTVLQTTVVEHFNNVYYNGEIRRHISPNKLFNN
jgi:hypothetical protein